VESWAQSQQGHESQQEGETLVPPGQEAVVRPLDAEDTSCRHIPESSLPGTHRGRNCAQAYCQVWMGAIQLSSTGSSLHHWSPQLGMANCSGLCWLLRPLRNPLSRKS
jgi:hypothetical protein